MQAKKTRDIEVHAANTEGRDLIVGDIHGNANLRDLIEGLNGTDRLYIVGDLCDRGPNSQEVFQMVMDHAHEVFCVRGNHEARALECIELLEGLLLNAPASFFAKNILRDVIEDSYNEEEGSTAKKFRQVWAPRLTEDLGGYTYSTFCKPLFKHIFADRDWLISLFLDESEEGFILVDDTSEKVTYEHQSKIGAIKSYISELPYIIVVDGPDPLKIVHADMPFDDNTLQARILQDAGLTEEEKHYAMYARLEQPGLSFDTLITRKENEEDALTCVGHTILDQTPVVRGKTVVNLDSGNSFTDSFLVVNHQERRCFFANAPTEYPWLQRQEKILSQFLKERPSSNKSGFFTKPDLCAVKLPITKTKRLLAMSVASRVSPDVDLLTMGI